MNKYESVIIVKPNLSERELEKLVIKIEDKIRENAEIIKKDDMGIKRLAYEIRKNTEGHYFIYKFQVNSELSSKVISEIERFYRITDEIMKYVVVKQDN